MATAGRMESIRVTSGCQIHPRQDEQRGPEAGRQCQEARKGLDFIQEHDGCDDHRQADAGRDLGRPRRAAWGASSRSASAAPSRSSQARKGARKKAASLCWPTMIAAATSEIAPAIHTRYGSHPNRQRATARNTSGQTR